MTRPSRLGEAAQPIATHAERFLCAIRDRALPRARRLLSEHPQLAQYSIHTAAAAGDAEAVAGWLARDPAAATAPDPSSGTEAWPPLIYACWSGLHTTGAATAAGLLRTAELLLDRGVDPNTFTLCDSEDGHSKLSSLYRACANSHDSVVRLLLDRGAAVNDGESVYHAAQLNHRECLELLLAHGADLSGRHEHWGNTPLYFLAGHEDDEGGSAAWVQGMRWLLEHGADPNVPSGTSAETPLHRVAGSVLGPTVAELLVAHGADVNRRRADGRTPYVLAMRSGNAAIAALLEARGANRDGATAIDQLLGACMRADPSAASALIEANPDLIGVMTADDRALFAQAVSNGRVDSVRLMAELGFDLTWEDDWGGTPLHWAAWRGNPTIVRLLLQLGAPINVRDRTYGSSPIAWAAHGSTNCRRADDDYCEVVTLLLDAGAEYETAINKENEPPFDFASPKVATLLRGRGFGEGAKVRVE